MLTQHGERVVVHPAVFIVDGDRDDSRIGSGAASSG
jgi:hypothetical protein